uniref:tetratricopeptide repeat protein n=1 Tax=Streptomyces chisholmiae TaxID=3075540 RepID=UPI00374E1630
MLRRAFMTGGPAALASLTALGAAPSAAAGRARPGAAEVTRVRQAVRDIRLLDDQHGSQALYRPAGEALRTAYELLDIGAKRATVNGELHSNTGELALSVGWLAHDSRRYAEARSYYAEALATARVGGDPALEAHAFCNTAFLARDTGRPREAVRAAQAGARAAQGLASDHLRSLLALREAAGWAGMSDRGGAQQALAQARAAYERGRSPESPEWMSFFGDGEFASLEGQCWALLGDWRRAGECARRAVAAARRDPHFARNIALYSAELAGFLARAGQPEEAAEVGHQTLDLLDGVHSTRITELLADTTARLHPARGDATVAAFLQRARSRPVLPSPPMTARAR